MNKYILDACALISFLNDEEGADVVEKILIEEQSIIHIINLYEVYYDYKRKNSCKKKCRTFYNKLLQLPFEIKKEIDYSLIKEASFYKINYSISFADSFALGLAKTDKAKLVTSDHHEFDVIEDKEELNFKWIR